MCPDAIATDATTEAARASEPDAWFHDPIHSPDMATTAAGRDYWVFNKPAGISILADRQSPDCLWSDLKRLLNQRGSRPYMVHRLDKGTSGVWAVATSQERQRQLTRAFETREVRKYYIARVTQAPKLRGRTGTMNLPLTNGRKSRYRVAGAREAIERNGNTWELANTAGFPGATRKTAFASQTRLRRLDSSTLLLQPLTGRTHQLRVHLAWTGSPIKGDHLYGSQSDPKQQWPRLALHCHRLVLPEAGSFTAPLPSDFRS